jgi:hypothetical protein
MKSLSTRPQLPTRAASSSASSAPLARYRKEHGEFPPSLETLVPEFLDRVPWDVMDGQPSPIPPYGRRRMPNLVNWRKPHRRWRQDRFQSEASQVPRLDLRATSFKALNDLQTNLPASGW